jgi:phage terminase Nu1 subunit (DNA packaging protein)
MARPKLVNQAEYARLKGVDKSHITRLIKQGKLTRTKSGKIDPAKADLELAAAAHPAHRARSKAAKNLPAPEEKPAHSNGNGSSGAGGKLTFTEASTKKETFAAHLKQLEFEAESKRLVDRQDVTNTAFEVGRIVRNAIMKVSSRIASVVASETDHRVCKRLIDEELRLALEPLADGELAKRLAAI